MLKRKESAIKEDDLLEMAAEQFALLFWKQIINKRQFGFDKSIRTKPLPTEPDSAKKSFSQTILGMHEK